MMVASTARSRILGFAPRRDVREAIVQIALRKPHLLAARLLASSHAQGFEGDVRILKDDLAVDAKDIFELPTLVATYGTTLVLEATGEGAAEVIEQLVRLFESNFEAGESSDS